jgi:hypothetical protein
MCGFVVYYRSSEQRSQLETLRSWVCRQGSGSGAGQSLRCVGSSEHESRIRWRCTQPPLHLERCGGAESRPAPKTPVEKVDLACWQPCHACHGSLEVLCPHCDGEGSLPIELQFLEWVEDVQELQCDACKGQGYLTCQECQKQGFIPRWNEAETAQARAALEDR